MQLFFQFSCDRSAFYRFWRRLPRAARSVFTVLSDYSRRYKKAFPSVATISRLADYSTRHTQKMLALLERAGLIRRQARKWQSNEYIILLGCHGAAGLRESKTFQRSNRLDRSYPNERKGEDFKGIERAKKYGRRRGWSADQVDALVATKQSDPTIKNLAAVVWSRIRDNRPLETWEIDYAAKKANEAAEQAEKDRQRQQRAERFERAEELVKTGHKYYENRLIDFVCSAGLHWFDVPTRTSGVIPWQAVDLAQLKIKAL